MKLVRELGNFKQSHNGPQKNGTFWALKTHNDLPGKSPCIEADLEYLLKCGKVWIQNVSRTGWKQIINIDELPKFSSKLVDDYYGCTSRIIVQPFLPEFYFVPTSWRGKRFLRRAINRAN